jgi:uncharacterized protein
MTDKSGKTGGDTPGSKDGFDYAKLTQEALRGVVRAVLTRVAEDERLPGNHHFFISFLTQADGVGVSKRLREQYPEEMTIALQHRFWDLMVHDDRFEVKLTFNGVPERLVVPFDAIRVFVDPSAHFAIPFDVSAKPDESRPKPAIVTNGPRPAAMDGEARPDAKEPRKSVPALRSVDAVPAPLPENESTDDEPPTPPEPPGKRPKRAPLRSVDTPADAPAGGAGGVVDISTFRKK